MATVPIEIVLQDAETPVDPAPTPTPENGEGTNIVLPNTGTISNDGNSNGGIGSTASIILPAIIAVLALGAMVALLIRRQQRRKKANNSNDSAEECNVKVNKKIVSGKEKLATATSGTIAILAATVLVGNLVIPATNAATDNTNNNGSNDNSITSNEGTYLETEDKITITAIIGKDSEEDAYTVSTKDTLYATTDASGYTVTMSMIEGALTSNLYLDGDDTSEYYIASVEENTELTNNTWGYMLDQEAEGYNAVPLADTPATIKEGEEAATHEEIDVYYTVKVNKELPLGIYTGTIEYNITQVNPIDKLTYMQDFASFSEEDKTKLLASMTEGEQYILKDKRDEKPYYISKLADGNVWMTQNLDHDIGDIEGGTYTSVDTDLPSGTSWTPDANNGEYTKPTSDTSWDNSWTTPKSYDPGDLYWNGVVVGNQANCEASGGTWYDSYGGYCTGYDTISSTGNFHYYLGNYYNWTAALAMSDSSSYGVYDEGIGEYINTETNQSICPAGWMLPTNSGDKSFDNLVTEVSLESGVNGNTHINPNWFGYSDGWAGSSENVGYDGYYWSGAAVSEQGAYAFYFTANGGLISQYVGGRGNGYSVRCMVR